MLTIKQVENWCAGQPLHHTTPHPHVKKGVLTTNAVHPAGSVNRASFPFNLYQVSGNSKALVWVPGFNDSFFHARVNITANVYYLVEQALSV